MHEHVNGSLAFWFPALPASVVFALVSCGGQGSTPAASGGDFLFTESNLQEGATWLLDAPIELRFSEALDFSSVTTSTVQVIETQTGTPVLGDLVLGLATTGLPDPALVRFLPACPDPATGINFGFHPGGIEYSLIANGADSDGPALHSSQGDVLASSIRIDFRTPVSGTASDLYQDARLTPAAVVLRGSAGVALDEFAATHVEVGTFPPVPAFFEIGAGGQGALNMEAQLEFPNGLPLHHRIAPDNRIAFVIHFDQAIDASEANIARVGMQYLDGIWRRLRGQAELVGNCESTGFAVRFRPEGFLPRGTTLRLAIEAGFRDRAGQVNGLAVEGVIFANTTNVSDAQGAPSDALFEGFFLGGDAAGSIEDTVSSLPYPRAQWGQGALIPQPNAAGLSIAQSEWVHIGYGKIDPGMPDRPATFLFDGVDEQGAVEHMGGTVVLSEDTLGPIALTALEETAVIMDLAQVADPVGSYLAHPALLTGSRVVFAPGDSSVPGAAGGVRIVGASQQGGQLRIELDAGCFIPGVGPTDCVALNLLESLGDLQGVQIQIVPKFLELYLGFQRDVQPPDASIQIRFDGAFADADGNVDPATALSQVSEWTSDVAVLGAQPWDFIRFQVLFDLDASDDGWSTADGIPVLSYLEILHEHGL